MPNQNPEQIARDKIDVMLKTKLKAEGSELSQKSGQLKMKSADGKFYKTDVARY